MMYALPEPTIQLLADNRPPWRMVVGALLAGVVLIALTAQAAVLVEFARDEKWMALSEVEFRDPNLLPNTVAETFRSPSVWHPMADTEGISEKDFLNNYSVVIAGGGTQIIRITFSDTDAIRAQRVVTGIVAEYLSTFGPKLEEPALEVITSHLSALEALQSELQVAIQTAGESPRELQIDLQNQLLGVRRQITSVLLRMDLRQADRLVGRETEPRIVSNAFVATDPLTPNPGRALVFGATAGGLVALGAIYLGFHRTAQPAAVESTSPPVPPQVRSSQIVSTVSSPVGRSLNRILKRSLDIAVSAAALVLLGPLLLLIAVAVKLTSAGPTLFRQARVGQFGQLFVITKFRTMNVNNNDQEHREFVLALLQDPSAGPMEDGTYKLIDSRVTRTGALLRRFSLDELPQLWNVLKGDMSLVGPRPMLPWEWELLGSAHRQRGRVPPGCTGLWQVAGRNLVSTMEMLALDLAYVQRWSFWRDIIILVRTPLVVLRGDGAR